MSSLPTARDLGERLAPSAGVVRSTQRHAGVPSSDLITLIEELDAVVWEADARTWQFTFVSGRAETLLGYPARQWIEEVDFWQRHIHPDDRERTVALCREATARGVDHRFDYRMIGADGRVVWLRDHVRVSPDQHGDAVCLRGVMIDISEHTRSETAARASQERLRESEDRYRALFDALPDGVAVHADSRILVINPAGARLLGVDNPAELVGRHVLDFIHPDSRELVTERLRTLYEDRLPVPSAQIRLLRVDGGDGYVELAGTPLNFDGKNAAQTVTRDVSDRVRAEAALRDAEDQLRQSQKLEAIGRLAGGIAHDFNNLLTVIGVYVELVLNALAPSDPRRRDAEEAKRATLRAGDLTHQLLAFSRRQVLKPTIVDLNEVVRDSVKMLRRILVEDIRIEAPLLRRALFVRADRGQLEQMLLNLALNARDAMPTGGTLTLHTDLIDVTEEFSRRYMGVDVAPGRYVRLGVSDTGAGMDETTRARLFEPFFTTKPMGQGTGLGLSTVYGIVKQSEGYIWVESALGAGTNFTIYLPEHDGEPPMPATVAATEGGGNETILLAEDDDNVRGISARILRSGGYHVLEARNGQEAVGMARDYRGEIHLLLTDVVMPGMGGRELADNASPLRPRMKVIFTSGYTNDEILRRGLATTSRPFLSKPFTITGLLAKVRDVLESSKAAASSSAHSP